MNLPFLPAVPRQGARGGQGSCVLRGCAAFCVLPCCGHGSALCAGRACARRLAAKGVPGAGLCLPSVFPVSGQQQLLALPGALFCRQSVRASQGVCARLTHKLANAALSVVVGKHGKPGEERSRAGVVSQHVPGGIPVAGLTLRFCKR